MRTDEDDDTPVDQTAPAAPYPWEKPPIAEAVRSILVSLEAPPVDERTLLALQRIHYRRNLFGSDGMGHIVIVLRCILEFTGNETALIEPIVTAVSSCLRTEFVERGVVLLEAFDQLPLLDILESMRGLDLFKEQTIGHYLGDVLHNKLLRILAPAKPAPRPIKAPAIPKLPRFLTRVPEVEKSISLGIELLALRAAIPGNAEFGHQVRRRFDIDQKTASGAMKAARAYGTRPEIYRRLSWIALTELSSPKMSPSVRQAIEAKILAGELVTAPEIRRARGPLKRGSPKRRQAVQPARMAA